MTQAGAIGGPVSDALESDLRTWIRRHGVAVWLDLDDHYSAFVDRLTMARDVGSIPYDVRSFRGSHLELMLALEGLAAGSEKAPLLVHLPGFNEVTVRGTPIFELYSAGVRYRKALDTIVTDAAAGRVRPDLIASFRDQPGLSLESADAWLQAQLAAGDSGVAAQLHAMRPEAVFDDLLSSDGFLPARLSEPADAAAVWERIAAWTGLPASWRAATLPGPGATSSAEDVAFCAASWALCVEYVNDLARAPVNEHLSTVRELPQRVAETCGRLASHLRERHADFYRRTADETEALLADEVEAARAEDLGKIDTFRFEEDRVLEAALAALAEQAWDAAAEWAGRRVGDASTIESHWLRIDPGRRSAWQLIDAAARLGQAIVRSGDRLDVTESLAAAADAYAARGAPVDQAHRHLEQRRVALLYPQLPHFAMLRARLDGLRGAWRSWADAWARDFNALCVRHGFLPDAASQQRTLFDDVVKPMAQETGTTALFVVDALRFEMGEELYASLADTPATTVQLRTRLAELPTVTEVGMNVLAPVSTNGRLQPALSSSDGGRIGGFSTGEFRVFDPKTRQRAMHDRVGGRACPWLSLEDVLSRDATALKRTVAQAELVVVHSLEIDKAGENGVGPAVFDVVMQKLRAAWRMLRDAGVRRFVITSDHGFLLLDEGTGSAQAHGRKIDPKRRHVFSPVGADHTGEVRVELSDLGYDGVDAHLMFPESTAVFDTGKRSMSFVHGGNSLQERVIPVLTVVHRAAAGGSTLQYRVTAKALDGVAGMHCVEVKLMAVAQGGLDFGSPKDVELALRVPDVDDVHVELCHVRGQARIAGGAIHATVGSPFELFFRLAGPADARVLVELHHPSAVVEVRQCVPDARFEVAASRARAPAAAIPAPDVGASAATWVLRLPEGGVRQVFEHLAAHGAITEVEAAGMLGGPRAARRFAVRFDDFAEMAPFRVRIDVVGNVKRYVREGNA